MLHDNMTDQININIFQQQQQQRGQHMTTSAEEKIVGLSTEMKRKRRQKKRCCGYLRYRTLALIIFLFIIIIVVIWYFVWPSITTLSLNSVDNIGSIQVITNTTQKQMSTQWSLNMTADNTANWVPTRFDSIDLTITDDSTNQVFGNGTTGWLELPGRKKTILDITMDIYYSTSNSNDTTFQDLYNACGVQVTSSTPFDNQQDVLNVTLHVDYHISGLVWSTTKQMPIIGLNCTKSKKNIRYPFFFFFFLLF
jgi:hypothetical protein